MKNRYKISEEYIKNWDLKNKSKRILDAGAGEQRIKKFIKNNDYISQDFGEYKVDIIFHSEVSAKIIIKIEKIKSA